MTKKQRDAAMREQVAQIVQLASAAAQRSKTPERRVASLERIRAKIKELSTEFEAQRVARMHRERLSDDLEDWLEESPGRGLKLSKAEQTELRALIDEIEVHELEFEPPSDGRIGLSVAVSLRGQALALSTDVHEYRDEFSTRLLWERGRKSVELARAQATLQQRNFNASALAGLQKALKSRLSANKLGFLLEVLLIPHESCVGQLDDLAYRALPESRYR